MNKKILVLGATGFVGAACVRSLLKEGFSVRALVRDEAKARRLLGDAAEFASGDFSDSGALEKALEGCDGVNLSVPWKREAEVVAAVTSILVRRDRQGVRISYISGISVHPGNRSNPMVAQKLKAEETLRLSGVTHTVLKPNWFLEALALFVRDGRATMFGKQRRPFRFLSLEDFAASVAAEHRSDSTACRTVVLEGPEELLMKEALQRYCVAHHSGIKVSVMPVGFGRLLAGLLKSPEMRDFVDLMAFFDAAPIFCKPEDFDAALTVPVVGLDDWLRRGAGKAG
jgi:uncharacterized protein YbjT (DUF2867 family)